MARKQGVEYGTIVYGSSDDLIEVEGGKCAGEVGCYGTDNREHGVLLVFSDGTLLEVKYGKNDEGIWEVKLVKKERTGLVLRGDRMAKGELMKAAAKSVEPRATAGYRGDSLRNPRMSPAPKKPVKNAGTPPGDFGEFLVKWFDSFRRSGETNEDARVRLQSRLGELGLTLKSTETIRSWEQGKSGPTLRDFGTVAKALGYEDWFALVAAIRKSKRK